MATLVMQAQVFIGCPRCNPGFVVRAAEMIDADSLSSRGATDGTRNGEGNHATRGDGAGGESAGIDTFQSVAAGNGHAAGIDAGLSAGNLAACAVAGHEVGRRVVSDREAQIDRDLRLRSHFEIETEKIRPAGWN